MIVIILSKILRYFLIPASNKNNLIYLFIIPTPEVEKKTIYFVEVESSSILCTIKIVYFQTDCFTKYNKIMIKHCELTELNTTIAGVLLNFYLFSTVGADNCSFQNYLEPGGIYVFLSTIGVDNRSFQSCQKLVKLPNLVNCQS